MAVQLDVKPLEAIGLVQSIKKDRKGLKLNDAWYSSFMPLPNDLVVGEIIKVTYKENKGFRNISKFDYVSEKEEAKKTPELTNKKEIDVRIKDTILMCAKDILIAHMNKDLKITLEEVTEKVIDAYKQIEKL